MARCPIFQVLFVGLSVFFDVSGSCILSYKVVIEYRGATPFIINGSREYGPRVEYTWFKVLPTYDYPLFNTSRVTNWGSYVIFHEFEREDEILYKCELSEGYRRYPNYIVDLRRIKMEPGPPLHWRTFYTGNEHTYVALNCTMTGSVEGDDIQYRWETPGGIPIPINPDRLYVDLRGTLHFNPIRFSDAKVKGQRKEYVCYVSSDKLNRGLYGSPVYAIVHEYNRENVVRGPPYLVYKNRDFKIKQGKNAILECVFHIHVSRQQIKYIWFLPNEENVTESYGKYELQFTGRRLVIHDIRKYQQGKYSCQAWNAWGNSYVDEFKPNNTIWVEVDCGF